MDAAVAIYAEGFIGGCGGGDVHMSVFGGVTARVDVGLWQPQFVAMTDTVEVRVLLVVVNQARVEPSLPEVHVQHGL